MILYLVWVAGQEESIRVADVGEESVKLWRVQILFKELEEDVVSIGASTNKSLDVMGGSGFGASLKSQLAEVGSKQQTQLGEHHQDSDDDHHEEPDPDYQVDLLVDDVDGKITHSWGVLHLSAVTKEGHLAHYNWK